MAMQRAVQTHTHSLRSLSLNPKKSFTNSPQHLSTTHHILNHLPWLPASTPEQVLALLKQQTHYRAALDIFIAALQQKGFRHTHSTYTLIIRILGQARKFKAMEILLQRMKKEPFFAFHSGKVFSDVARLYIRVGKPESAIATFYSLHTFNCEYTQKLFNTLLRHLINTHCLDIARDIFHDPKLKQLDIVPDAYSYNLLIKAYCRENKLGSAFGLFEYMQKQGCLPDVITFGTLVWGLCINGRVQESFGVLDQMYDKGFAPDNVIYNTIIDGLCRHGEFVRANEMLLEMELIECKPDVVTYNTLINGLCKAGQLQEAVKLLKDMPQKGINPDVVSFSTVMNFAWKEGKLQEFRMLYSDMLDRGVRPDAASCKILVKGICKEGMFAEAIHIVHNISPNVVSYKVIMISLCDNGMFNQARQILAETLKKGFTIGREKEIRAFRAF